MHDDLLTPAARETTQSRAQVERRRYLLILDLAAPSSSIHDLPPLGELVIGRSDKAGIALGDNLVSREHARLRINAREVAITDLGSQNGTRVNGELLSEERVLSSGDAIVLSPQTTLVFHAPPTPRKTVPYLERKQLGPRLEEELERASRYLRAVSVLVVRWTRAMELIVTGSFERALRPIDLVQMGSGEAIIVLPELDSSEADSVATLMLEDIESRGGKAQVGYATYPTDAADADSLIAGARMASEEAKENRALAASAASSMIELGGSSVVVADPAMVRIYALAKRLAASDVPVLILGETGSGKEMVAQALHGWSPRNTHELVTLNCAALPESLIESELFGFEKGAFSGASGAKAGHLERAHHGTLFLDEIGELPPVSQAKLLRVLETKQLLRLGAVREKAIDIRIIGATHRKLDADVASGAFRRDLYYRLNTATLCLPALRDRPREIPILARRLLDQACERAGRAKMVISSRALSVLVQYSWPGNIRELKNTMDYVAATSAEDILEVWQLPGALLELVDRDEAGDPNTTDSGTGKRRLFRPIEEEVRDLERKRMAEALAVAGGVQKVAAELLSMPLRTFVTKLKRYELQGPKR